MTEETRPLIIDYIRIDRETYGSRKGQYTASVRVEGQHSNLELALPDEITTKVIAVIGEQIVEGSRIVANALTSQALAAPALEHQPEA